MLHSVATIFSRVSTLFILSAVLVAKTANAEDSLESMLGETPEEGFELEICFVLDTTGSMTGLIEGAKRKIWAIANNIAAISPTPSLRFSLIAYRDRGDDYITKVTDLTADIDFIYNELVAFKANGGGDGPESVNQALFESVHDISWSSQSSVIKAIFLVGDFPPHMDYPEEQQYPKTVQEAVASGIVVNAIQAGSNPETTLIWKQIASSGGGIFSQIAQSGAMEHIATHYDQDLVALNIKLGETLLPYGSEDEKDEIQSLQNNSEKMSYQELSDRVSYNSRTRKIVQRRGDLIDDLDHGVVELASIPEAHLPERLQNLSPEEQVGLINEFRMIRELYQQTILSLAIDRQKEIDAKQNHSSFDQEVVELVQSIAASKEK